MTVLQNHIQLIGVQKQHLTKPDSIAKVRAAIDEIIKTNKNAVIYYKAGCNDGVAAAYLIREHVTKLTDVKPEAFPISYNQDPDFEQVKEMGLIIYLDVCPKLEQASKIINNGTAVLVIDHHKSSFDHVIKNINDHIEQMSKPTLLIFSDDNSASGAELARLFTDSEAHEETIHAIGQYDRRDKETGWHAARALNTLIKSRMPTVPKTNKLDVIGEYITRLPSVIFGMAIKFYDHHQAVIVSLAANAFNNTDVITSETGDRKAIYFTCDRTQFSDMADLMLSADINLQYVCGLCYSGDKIELCFMTVPDRSVRPAIEYALELGGGGHMHSAEYLCTIDQLPNAIKRLKFL